MLTHIDLFSGIAGFTLACQWAGITTEVFCENDKRCQEFLRRTYPGIPIVPNIREFDGTKWRGRFLLTGGVPCQPASRAGKQRGKADDRWLWSEALRVVSEARPDWVLFENPLGINDVGLGGILADLEVLDYEIAPILNIPACAVNSPQLRQRYWIVAYCDGSGRKEFGGTVTDESEYSSAERTSQGDVADTPQDDDRRSDTGESERQVYEFRGGDGSFWSNSIWLPCADGKLRRAPDDSFGVVDGLQYPLPEMVGPFHRSILAALGNSIVPQVAFEIIQAIVRASNEAV